MLHKIKALLLFTAVPLGGCGTAAFTEPATNPVIEDRLGSAIYGEGEVIGTLATTADRRIVLTPLIGNPEGKFCAEPSPDVAQSVAATFGAAIDLSSTATDQAEAKLKGEFARSLMTSVGALTRRSQGLQYFRDGMFSLCQFRMNAYIDEANFFQQYQVLRDKAAELMAQEIATANWGKLPPLVISAPDAKQPETDKDKS